MESVLAWPLMDVWTPFVTAAAYLAAVYLTLRSPVCRQKSLASWQPLKLITAGHNLILSVMSAALFAFASYSLVTDGPWLTWRDFLCLPSGNPVPPGKIRLSLYLFYVTKYWELIDTFLHLFKRGEVTFLHVYHHAVVIPYCWMLARSDLPYTIGFVIGNTLVHVFMYYYYFAVSLRLPVGWKKAITVLQISQFTVGVPCGLAYIWFTLSTPCWEPLTTACCCAFDFSLLILFVRFHRNTYGKKPKD
eukprot:TRINITY_DN16791_c0_g1_i1.p1 TRINITY_DN16791_c0_g1~~TRINITY_DN16791_c0_g1_i1.p1  ORF type:complete len:254 (+),score=24.96 TRINITY_DN16791_c0_g1_i1:23-763(+)